MKVVLATIQRGRHAHLKRQLAAAAEATHRPEAAVVVSMDHEPPQLEGCDVVSLPVGPGDPLPLAAARNLAVARAEEAHGADLVVLLDVDCLPARSLIARYAAAASSHPGSLLAGAVTYLPPGIPRTGPLPTPAELQGLAPHAARPVAAPGVVVPEQRMELFWSLSFAVRPADHRRIGGFDEGYVGYGAEDTDYARRAEEAGIGLCWVGGAEAYHQHHPVSQPPVEHLHDIVRNARRYRSRWGAWPMEGWLEAFQSRGLVTWTADDLQLAPEAVPWS